MMNYYPDGEKSALINTNDDMSPLQQLSKQSRPSWPFGSRRNKSELHPAASADNLVQTWTQCTYVKSKISENLARSDGFCAARLLKVSRCISGSRRRARSRLVGQEERQTGADGSVKMLPGLLNGWVGFLMATCEPAGWKVLTSTNTARFTFPGSKRSSFTPRNVPSALKTIFIHQKSFKIP